MMVTDASKPDSAPAFYGQYSITQSFLVEHVDLCGHEWMAAMCFAAGDDKAAIRLLENAVAKHPQMRSTWVLLFTLYRQTNNEKAFKRMSAQFRHGTKLPLPEFAELPIGQVEEDAYTVPLEGEYAKVLPEEISVAAAEGRFIDFSGVRRISEQSALEVLRTIEGSHSTIINANPMVFAVFRACGIMNTSAS